MTEPEWLASVNPSQMWVFVEPRATVRRRFGYSAGCCRRVWDLLTDDRFRELVVQAEVVADGLAHRDSLGEMARYLAPPGATNPAPLPNISDEPLEPGQIGSVLSRHFYIGGGTYVPHRPARVGTGIVNFAELPLWCRSVDRAVRALVGGNPSVVCVAMADARGAFVADQQSETHPHRLRMQELRDHLAELTKRGSDLRWRGMSRQADEHAATVADFEAAMRQKFEQLEADISADWQLAFTERTTVERTANAELLRCVVGNPFRPVVFAPEWRSETVVRIAEGIDADRAFDRLPILADALEDAGCDAPDVLAHCRGSGSHARGCWVVDGVRGVDTTGP